MNKPQTSVTFDDGSTYKIGDRVRFHTRYGSSGSGTVVGFSRNFGTSTVRIAPDADTKYDGQYDRWPLKHGGVYNRISDTGLYGGEFSAEPFLPKTPGETVTLLVEVNTDGYTYTSRTPRMLFADESVADLVVCELNNRFSGQRSFDTLKLPLLRTADETDVNGIIADLLKTDS